nr:uncharacterized protein LOC111418623 isoform X2 [Onthophagus taurus]
MYRLKITFDEKKKDAEMIFNIQWKNKTVCVDARSNMVGMLDGSATNDYHTFKTYLLNNSGTFVNNVDNVRVSYIAGDNECYIENDFDYDYALPFFRGKALAGQYIDLKLDYVDRSRVKDKEIPPPDWFLKYMKKFKEDIVSEVSAIVLSKQHQSNSHPIRKLKPESYKRSRKVPLLVGDTNDRELLTKVRTKLEKLEHKATKLKTKKALMGLSSDSDAGKSSKSETNQPQSAENDVEMSAALITPNKKGNIPYLSGGETYVHTWEVKNNGSLPWNSSTKLKYAWGSQAFEPWEKNITCPFLKPGESGCISAIFNVPALPGMYECYWHFYNNGKRFGISLSSVVMIADNPVKAENYIRSPTYDVINIQDDYELVLPTTWTIPPQKRNSQSSKIETHNQTKSEPEKTQKMVESSLIIESKDETDCIEANQVTTKEEENCDAFQGEGDGVENNDGSKIEAEERLETENRNIEIDEKIDFDLFLDESDDQSIISISDSNSSYDSKNEFVMLESNTSNLNIDDVRQNIQSDTNDLLVDAVQDTDGISDSKLQHECQEPKIEHEHEKEEEVKTVDVTDNQTNGVSDVKLATQTVSEDDERECNNDDKNDDEDVVKGENIPTGSAKTTKDEFGYIIYEGKIVRIPKRYLNDGKSQMKEKVVEIASKSQQSNQNENKLQKNATLNTENATAIKTKDNGTIPKNINKIKKERIVKKSKSPESKVPDTLKKRLDLDISPEMFTYKTKKNPTSTVNLNEKRRKAKESMDVKQRFFVFPQQGPGYEMVEHSRKIDDLKDDDPNNYLIKTQYDESSGIVNMYIVYAKDNIKEPNVYGYFVPLEYVQDHSLQNSPSIRDEELIYYAIPVDVEALFKSKTEEMYCRFILMKLHHGPYSEDTARVLCDVSTPNTQSIFNLSNLKTCYHYHQQMNAAAIDKQYPSVITFGSQHMVVYEIASASRRYAFDMDIRPQNVVPESSLRLRVHTLALNHLTAKKGIKGEEIATNTDVVIGDNKGLSSKCKKEIQLGKVETHLHHKKYFEHPSAAVNMFILYYFDYKIEPDVYAYFVPLKYAQHSLEAPSDRPIQNKNELIFYSVPVDLEALFNHSCGGSLCKTGVCNSKFILIPLNLEYSEYMYNNVLYPVWKKYLFNLSGIKRYCAYYDDETVISPTGQKYIVYAIFSLERQIAWDMNIRPQDITDILHPEKLLKLCVYTYEPQHPQKVNETPKCSGTQSVEHPTEMKEKLALTNDETSLESEASNPSSTSVQNIKAATPKPGNSSKKIERIKSREDVDGTSRISGLIEGFKGKMGDIRNTVIDTAKDIVEIVTLPNQSNIGYWRHGHWISTNPNSKREQALQVLQEMGFNNRDLNATLLARYGDDLNLALSRLLEYNLDV